MAKISQNQRVLNHLIDHGYITQVVAMSYGIRRLPARIDELRKIGTDVRAELKKDDAGVRYALYTMPEHAREYEQNARAGGIDWKGRATSAEQLGIDTIVP